MGERLEYRASGSDTHGRRRPTTERGCGPVRRPQAVVVDDSRFMRELITDTLESGGIDVVATAADGREAVETVASEAPDVVTMDVNMPEVDGIEATKRIMRETPTPILMLSAHTAEGADETFAALDAGAVDFIAKPGGEVSAGMSALEDQLAETVRSVADANVEAAARGARTAPSATGARATAPRTTVLIGSSTGGPDAVERVLGSLPARNTRAVVVQHMPAAFTGRFAERLNDAAALDVREASDGDRLGEGEAVVAPGEAHLEVSRYRNGRLRVRTTTDPDEGVVPSVNVTFRSAADQIDDPLVGVILTGMGSDGADGVQAVQRAGGRVIAQDEATSVVYGMPKRAAATGAVDEILPLGEIADGVVGGVADV